MPIMHDLSAGSLRVLVEVVRQGSFTGAARALDYTQSAVSRQISSLEADVGSLLFDRRARGVQLTEAGHRLLAHATVIVDRLDDARNELIDLRELRVGRLRVGAFATANASLIPHAVSTFKTRHPGVQVSLHEGFSAELLRSLIGGQLDLAVISSSAGAPAPAGVAVTKIVDDTLFVALPTDHRFAARRRLRLADLSDDDWIAGSSAAEDTLLSPLLRRGFAPRVGFDAMDWVAKQGFVAAGVGITLIPSLAVAAARRDIALVALDLRDVPARSVYAVTPANVTRSPATESFLDVLTQHRPTTGIDQPELDPRP